MSVPAVARGDGLGGVLYYAESPDGGRTWPAFARKTEIPNPGSKATLYGLDGDGDVGQVRGKDEHAITFGTGSAVADIDPPEISAGGIAVYVHAARGVEGYRCAVRRDLTASDVVDLDLDTARCDTQVGDY